MAARFRVSVRMAVLCCNNIVGGLFFCLFGFCYSAAFNASILWLVTGVRLKNV